MLVEVVFAFSLLAGGLLEWRLNWLVDVIGGVWWLACFGAAGDVGCGGNVEHDVILTFSFNSVCAAQAAGFGDGETFTDKTFTGDAFPGHWDHIKLEEMEVFAVSGYP